MVPCQLDLEGGCWSLSVAPEDAASRDGNRASTPTTLSRELWGVSAWLALICAGGGAGVPSGRPLGTHPKASGPCYSFMQIF